MLRINMMNKTKRSAVLLLSLCTALQLAQLPLHATDEEKEVDAVSDSPSVSSDKSLVLSDASVSPDAQPKPGDDQGLVAGTIATIKEHKYAVGGVAATLAAGALYWGWDNIKELVGLDDSDDDEEEDKQEDAIVADDSNDAGWSRNQKIAAGVTAAGATAAAGVAAYKYRDAIQAQAGGAQTWVKENPKKSAAGVIGVGVLGLGAYFLSGGDDEDDEKTPEATDRGKTADKKQKKMAIEEVQKTFVSFSTEFVSSFKTKHMVKRLTSLHNKVVKAQNPMLYFEHEFAKPLTAEQQNALHNLVQFFAHNIMSAVKLTAVQRAHYEFVASLAHTQYTSELFVAFRAFAQEKNIVYYQLFNANGTDNQEAKRKAFFDAVIATQTKK